MNVVASIIAVQASDSPTAMAVCASADLCVWFGSVWFRPKQICAVTDSVSEQQRSVRSISSLYLDWFMAVNDCSIHSIIYPVYHNFYYIIILFFLS